MTRIWASAEPREAADRLMLLALADNANDAGVCWPSVPTLARKCGVEKRAAFDTLARLEAAGHVEIVRRSGRGNVYHLAPAAAAAGAVRRTGALPATRRAGRTPPRAAGRTGPVQGAAPEPSENPQENPHTNTTAPQAPTVPRVAGVGNVRERTARRRPIDPSGTTGLASEDHLDALVERGIRPDVAHRLAAAFGDRVDRTVAVFDRSGAYGPGWLVRAVESGWADEPVPARRAESLRAVVAEPVRLYGQAVAWLSGRGLGPEALPEHFESAGTRALDASGVEAPVYRLRAGSADKPGALKRASPSPAPP